MRTTKSVETHCSVYIAATANNDDYKSPVLAEPGGDEAFEVAAGDHICVMITTGTTSLGCSLTVAGAEEVWRNLGDALDALRAAES